VLCGQYITEKNVPSYQQVQTVNFLYAPVQYVLFSAGIGAAKMSIDSASGMQFVGNYGFFPFVRAFAFHAFFPEQNRAHERRRLSPVS